LSSTALSNIRTQAGKKYQAIEDAVRMVNADDEFLTAIRNLNDEWGSAAKEFPLIAKQSAKVGEIVQDLDRGSFSTKGMIALVKALRTQSSRGFRGIYDAEKFALAHAQRRAANLLDDLLERQLAGTHPTLIPQYREARKIIAATYDVGGALNDSTGNISAHRLGVLLDKGKPLTDELKFVGNFAKSYRKATQRPEAIGSLPMATPLDWYGAGGAAVITGHPAPLAAVALRPGMRAVALSKPYQKRLAVPKDVLPMADLNNLGRVARFGIPLSRMLMGTYGKPGAPENELTPTPRTNHSYTPTTRLRGANR